MRLTGLVAAPLLATATLAAAHMEAQHDSLAPRHVTRDASHVPDTELSLQKRTFGLLCSSSLLGWLCPSSTSTESSCSKCSEGSSEKHKSHKSKGHHRKHKVPRKDWDCDGALRSRLSLRLSTDLAASTGSGEDGYDYDHEGNSCPEKYHGFKWFGKTHGWQPPKHWTPKRSWEEPEGFKWKCKWVRSPLILAFALALIVVTVGTARRVATEAPRLVPLRQMVRLAGLASVAPQELRVQRVWQGWLVARLHGQRLPEQVLQGRLPLVWQVARLATTQGLGPCTLLEGAGWLQVELQMGALERLTTLGQSLIKRAVGASGQVAA